MALYDCRDPECDQCEEQFRRRSAAPSRSLSAPEATYPLPAAVNDGPTARELLAEDTLRRIQRVVGEHLGVDVADADASLRSLGADSLDRLEIVLAIEDEFGVDIDDDTTARVVTVADIVAVVTR